MKKVLAALIAAILIVGCERNLSRERAAELLRSHQTFRDQQWLTLSPPLADAGIRSGLFSKIHSATNLDHEDLVMSPLGSRYFASAHGIAIRDTGSPEVLGLGAECILRQPLQRQITGIVNITSPDQLPDIREVKFAWRYGSIPEDLKPIVHNIEKPYHGRALMRLKDGYWQIIESSLMISLDGRR